MKSVNKIFAVILLLGLVVNFTSCKKEKTIDQPNNQIIELENLVISPDFEFKTMQDVEIDVTALNNLGEAMSMIPIKIYQSSNGNYDEPLTEEEKGLLLFKGATNVHGVLKVTISIPSVISEIVIATDYVGLIDRVLVPIQNGQATKVIGGAANNKSVQGYGEFTTASYDTLGTWNSQGVPNYLEPVGDTVSQNLLDVINASLPEHTNLPISHPEYFIGGTEYGLHLDDSCDVWLTFVHEGAGWKNALGFYTYTEGNAPASVNDINNLTIIFPNTSFAGSGGGLHTGDKVYIGAYGENTVIEWFLVAQGWSSSNHTVGSGVYIHYSQAEFNVESSASLQQHNVLLYDDVSDVFILGFEDIRRDYSNCDQDFNDAIYYATANPIGGVDTTNTHGVDVTTDTDLDGVVDLFDDYPTDPTKAHNNFFPALGVFGSLAFEDLWPTKGDYDFNDVVVNYQYNLITNANNDVVEMGTKYVLRAMGAGYHNSFGVELPFAPSNVTSVTGGNYSQSFVELSANGTEAHQGNTVIIAFEDGYDLLSYPTGAGSIGVNTTAGIPFVYADTISQTIEFAAPILLANFGTSPFNPFIIINQQRGYEVHLPDMPATDLADETLFGQYNDDSDPLSGRYYKTENELPFAIHIPVSFDYPLEKSAINQGYLKFNDWAQSSGLSFTNWYTAEAGFRNSALIYQ